MIKPLDNVSSVAFRSKSGFEDYQEQIKNKKEPRYQLTLSPGVDEYGNKPGIKSGVAGIFKGFNNIAGIVSGTAKGLAKGILFGSLAGVAAKNWKETTSVVVNEAGKNIRKTDVKGFINGTLGDIFKFVGGVFRAIPEAFKKPPTETLKSLTSLPKKFFKYLGKSKAVKGIAIGVAALTLVYNIIKSKVEANRKNADIDHSWHLKH